MQSLHQSSRLIDRASACAPTAATLCCQRTPKLVVSCASEQERDVIGYVKTDRNICARASVTVLIKQRQWPPAVPTNTQTGGGVIDVCCCSKVLININKSLNIESLKETCTFFSWQGRRGVEYIIYNIAYNIYSIYI